MTEVRTIDSHTEGEPTRVVVEGIPDLGSGGAAERARRFREDHDGFRSAVCNEPRGFDAMVGALLLPPDDPGAVAQVIFFNNVSTLHMCVHGTIGVAETTTLKVASLAVSVRFSQARCSLPRMVLSAPSGMRLGERNSRPSRNQTSSSPPQRTLR